MAELKLTINLDEVNDPDTTDELYETQRNLMISKIGYKKWYEILEIEDNIKNSEIDDCTKDMINIIVYDEETKLIYNELLRLRKIRNDKWWREYVNN